MPSYKSHYLLNKQFCFPVWATLQTQAAVYAFVITDTLYKELWHVSDRLIKGKEEPSWDLDSIVILSLASPVISTKRCNLSTLHLPTCKMGWEPLICPTHLRDEIFIQRPRSQLTPVMSVWFNKDMGQAQAFCILVPLKSLNGIPMAVGSHGGCCHSPAQEGASSQGLTANLKLWRLLNKCLNHDWKPKNHFFFKSVF